MESTVSEAGDGINGTKFSNGIAKSSKRARLEDTESSRKDDEYFASYSFLECHQTMILDYARTQAYREAILKLYPRIYKKVCLDVGAGVGILSIFACQAGASKVYAVEASTPTAVICRQVVSKNNYEKHIEVINAPVENWYPDGAKHNEPFLVDAIISEWMGYGLLTEYMLGSVIDARDRFLKPAGLLIPSRARLYMVPVMETVWLREETCQRWAQAEHLYKVKLEFLGNLKEHNLCGETPKCYVHELSPQDCIAHSSCILDLNLYSITQIELKKLVNSFSYDCFGEVTFCGFALWFDVQLSEDVTLSTSPEQPPTHWQQMVLYLPRSQWTKVTQGTLISGDVTFAPCTSDHRLMSIDISYSVGSSLPQTVKVDGRFKYFCGQDSAHTAVMCRNPSLNEMVRLKDEGVIKHVTLTLHPGNDAGCSLSLPGSNCRDVCTQSFPYDDASDFLFYVDVGELPPFLVDILERCQTQVYYLGCVLVELKDWRTWVDQPGKQEESAAMSESGSGSPVVETKMAPPESKWVVLRPSPCSILADLNQLLTEAGDLSPADQLELEAQLLHLVAGPLENLHSAAAPLGQTVDSSEFRALFRAHTQRTVSRRKAEFKVALENSFLIAALALAQKSAASRTDVKQEPGERNDEAAAVERIKLELKGDNKAGASTAEESGPFAYLNESSFEFYTPSEVLSLRPKQEVQEICEDNMVIEGGFVVESCTPPEGAPDAGIKRTQSTIRILKRLIDQVYFGELQVDYLLENSPSGVTDTKMAVPVSTPRPVISRFFLGTLWDARVYLTQYLDMITEGGKKAMRIRKLCPEAKLFNDISIPESSENVSPEGLN